MTRTIVRIHSKDRGTEFALWRKRDVWSSHRSCSSRDSMGGRSCSWSSGRPTRSSKIESYKRHSAKSKKRAMESYGGAFGETIAVINGHLRLPTRVLPRPRHDVISATQLARLVGERMAFCTLRLTDVHRSCRIHRPIQCRNFWKRKTTTKLYNISHVWLGILRRCSQDCAWQLRGSLFLEVRYVWLHNHFNYMSYVF